MVLVVEDDTITRDLIGMFLNESRIPFQIAKNVDEALRKLSFSPEIILLDFILEDGYATPIIEMCQKLSPQTKIVLMSAAGKNEIEKIAKKFGIDDVLLKPFDLEELETKLIPRPKFMQEKIS